MFARLFASRRPAETDLAYAYRKAYDLVAGEMTMREHSSNIGLLTADPFPRDGRLISDAWLILTDYSFGFYMPDRVASQPAFAQVFDAWGEAVGTITDPGLYIIAHGKQATDASGTPQLAAGVVNVPTAVAHLVFQVATSPSIDRMEAAHAIQAEARLERVSAFTPFNELFSDITTHIQLPSQRPQDLSASDYFALASAIAAMNPTKDLRVRKALLMSNSQSPGALEEAKEQALKIMGIH